MLAAVAQRRDGTDIDYRPATSASHGIDRKSSAVDRTQQVDLHALGPIVEWPIGHKRRAGGVVHEHVKATKGHLSEFDQRAYLTLIAYISSTVGCAHTRTFEIFDRAAPTEVVDVRDHDRSPSAAEPPRYCAAASRAPGSCNDCHFAFQVHGYALRHRRRASRSPGADLRSRRSETAALSEIITDSDWPILGRLLDAAQGRAANYALRPCADKSASSAHDITPPAT